MAVKTSYKQTEVGFIPEDWLPRRIDSVCRLINGRGFRNSEWIEWIWGFQLFGCRSKW